MLLTSLPGRGRSGVQLDVVSWFPGFILFVRDQFASGLEFQAYLAWKREPFGNSKIVFLLFYHCRFDKVFFRFRSGDHRLFAPDCELFVWRIL